MTRGESASRNLTREDVIRVVSEALETDKYIYFSEVLTKLKAEEIANALGLTAPEPFERVAWCVWRIECGEEAAKHYITSRSN